MLRTRIPVALALFLYAASLAGRSACEKDPHNALADLNCGFTKNTDGWKTENENVTLKSVDGVLEVTSIHGMSTIVSGPCVDVVELASYTGSVRIRALKGEISNCRLMAQQFSEAGCRGNETGSSFNAFLEPDADWETASDMIYMGPPVGSLRMLLECDSGPHMTVQFDDVSLSVDPDTLPRNSGTSTTTSTADW